MPVLEATPTGAASPAVVAPEGTPKTETLATKPIVADNKTVEKSIEKPVEGQEKPEEKGPKESQRFAALARKEKFLVEEQRKISQAREQLQQHYGRIQQFEQVAQRAKLDPLGVLQALGVSQEELGAYILNDNKPTAEGQMSVLAQEVEALKQEREKDRQNQLSESQRRQEAQEVAVIEQYNSEVTEFVKSKPDDYEFILAYNQEPLVTQVIREAFDVNGGVLLSHKEAADMVEEYLSGLVEKGTKTKKYSSKLEATKLQPNAQLAPTRTLSNTHSASTPPSPKASFEDQRMARALAAAEAAKTRS